MTTVYGYRHYNVITDKFYVSRFKGTKRYIDRVRGELMRDTAEAVPSSAVDIDGRYDPTMGGTPHA